MEYIKFTHPFTCIVSGPSGSGKTHLITDIIKYRFKLIDKPIKKIYWYYSQVTFDSNEIRFIKGLPTEKQLVEEKPDLVIIDDLMLEMNPVILNLFTKFSHHLKISVFLLIQNLFFKNPLMRTISLNSQNIIIMKNPRDKTQVLHLAKQMYPGNTKFFIDCYNDATELPYGYIKIDLTPNTPDIYRLSTRIITNPIIYKPCRKI